MSRVIPPDERPLLICRVDCPPPLQEELDGWTPWHFDDFGRHYAVLGASSYKIIRDFDPETGLPAAFNASQATRFIPYVATSIPDMHAWIGSEVVTGRAGRAHIGTRVEVSVTGAGAVQWNDDDGFQGSRGLG